MYLVPFLDVQPRCVAGLASIASLGHSVRPHTDVSWSRCFSPPLPVRRHSTLFENLVLTLYIDPILTQFTQRHFKSLFSTVFPAHTTPWSQVLLGARGWIVLVSALNYDLQVFLADTVDLDCSGGGESSDAQSLLGPHRL